MLESGARWIRREPEVGSGRRNRVADGVGGMLQRVLLCLWACSLGCRSEHRATRILVIWQVEEWSSRPEGYIRRPEAGLGAGGLVNHILIGWQPSIYGTESWP